MQGGKQNLSATLPRQKPKVSTAIQDALEAVKLKATGGKPTRPPAMPGDSAADASQATIEALTGRAAGVMLRDRAVSRLGLSPLGHQRTL